MIIDERGHVVEQPGVSITVAIDVVLPCHGRVLYRVAIALCRLASWFANRATATVRINPATGMRMSARDEIATGWHRRSETMHADLDVVTVEGKPLDVVSGMVESTNGRKP